MPPASPPPLRVLVAAGPTREPLDPVRYLTNRSSGKQGVAVANSLAALGADVALVLGPVEREVASSVREGVRVASVETAEEMRAACLAALPADVFVMGAAVCDWRPLHYSEHKMKKSAGRTFLCLEFTQNPDILAEIVVHALRPRLVVGFAAETARSDAELLRLASEKRRRKGCDWIVANDVSPGTSVFGGDENRVLILGEDRQAWIERTAKSAVADRLADDIVSYMAARRADEGDQGGQERG
jgi:phosphopantothenoylcysteine decarboxylase/phosphopantothenate--cysteine ligase